MTAPTTAMTITTEPAERDYLPAMSIETAVQRHKQITQFIGQIMHKDVDFGAIPGTDKPTLLKPGAEKLCTFFGLRKVPELVSVIEDWTGKDHGGEAFFYYSYRYHLYRGETLIASADGSCNSWEKKYRWRNSDRCCPQCGAAAIKRSKYPPRDDPEASPGWYCFGKAGGCGANFDADDPDIMDQKAGRMPNPDIADVVNTLQKMAQKRALVAATLLAVNASEFFTQDAEDMVDDRPAEPEPPKQQPAPKPAKPVESYYQRLVKGAKQYNREWRLSQLLTETRGNTHQALDQLTKDQFEWIAKRLMAVNTFRSAAPSTPRDFTLWLVEYEADVQHEGLCAEGDATTHLREFIREEQGEAMEEWEKWTPEGLVWAWNEVRKWAELLRQGADATTAVA